MENNPFDEQIVDLEGRPIFELRDRFAMAAMQALLSRRDGYLHSAINEVSEIAYEVADAMLEERVSMDRAETEPLNRIGEGLL